MITMYVLAQIMIDPNGRFKPMVTSVTLAETSAEDTYSGKFFTYFNVISFVGADLEIAAKKCRDAIKYKPELEWCQQLRDETFS